VLIAELCYRVLGGGRRIDDRKNVNKETPAPTPPHMKPISMLNNF